MLEDTLKLVDPSDQLHDCQENRAASVQGQRRREIHNIVLGSFLRFHISS